MIEICMGGGEGGLFKVLSISSALPRCGRDSRV